MNYEQVLIGHLRSQVRAVDTLALAINLGVWLLSQMSDHNTTHYSWHASERMNE